MMVTRGITTLEPGIDRQSQGFFLMSNAAESGFEIEKSGGRKIGPAWNVTFGGGEQEAAEEEEQ